MATEIRQNNSSLGQSLLCCSRSLRVLSAVRRLPPAAYSWCSRHPVFSTFAFCIASIIAIFMSLTFSLNQKSQTQNVINGAASQSGLLFLGHIYNMDLANKTISISWLIIGCGLGFMIPGYGFYDSTHCGQPAIPIDVFVDGSVIANGSYSPNNKPQNAAGSFLYLQIFNEFQTTQLLEIEGGSHLPVSARSIFLTAQYGFPWDVYFLRTVFIAVNHENNATLPIVKLAPVDSANDFLPDFTDSAATCHFNGTNNTPCQVVSLELRRAPLAKAFNLIIYAVNWLLAGTVLFITVVACYAKKKMPEGLLLLPVTVILIVPSLRALMVNSPAFGILLDTIGLFPQMIIVSLCSVVLLLRLILKPFNIIRQHREPDLETVP